MKDKLRHVWYLLCRYVLIIIPDRLFVQITAFITYSRLGFPYRAYDLSNPVSFNEKLTKLKINPDNVDLCIYADKIEVREYVRNEIGEKYLVPLLGIYKSADEINFNSLPKKFVLKTNHGSGWNIICEDKGKLDFNKTRRRLTKWLTYNAFYLSREYQYKPIIPAILCEQFLERNIYDYKFFCFSGIPKFIQVDINRFYNHKRAFYDTEWTKQEFSIAYPIADFDIIKPDKLQEMLTISRILSKPFKFVRVDMYIHDYEIFFGELTFSPEGGNGPFIPFDYDYKLGSELNL